MKIELKLLRAKPETSEGFPLVIEISHLGKRRQKNIGYCKNTHFVEENKLISPKHPDYDILMPILMDYKVRAREIVLKKETDINKAFDSLFNYTKGGITIDDFGKAWIEQQRCAAKAFEVKGDIISRNKILGHVKVVENALLQFKKVIPVVEVAALDYATLNKFRTAQQNAGNTGNTIHLYLRALRALYNRACLEYAIPDVRPFNGVLNGLLSKSSDSKKKNLPKETILLLENLVLTGEKDTARDLFLLQFYFGGCDLKDIYYLKKAQVDGGRVRFERGKVRNPNVIDLKLHPKAKLILEKYTSVDDWLLPWRKDADGYETFRRRVQKNLQLIQQAQNAQAEETKSKKIRIDIRPMGGHLAPKVARHTFANIAKGLRIDPDIIRELMGHERNDVDNYYKDKYTEKVRDNALFKIIG